MKFVLQSENLDKLIKRKNVLRVVCDNPGNKKQSDC